ncbi:MAG: hypothetical protein PHV34_00940 [Verrucomicrobiae bacterium]|nr:hypothetical protein [Verrucomicrobiae bacterium]
MQNSTLAIRTQADNRDHHLWNNNGTWFVHYTVHPDPLTKQRIRHSLSTKSLAEARERRDSLFRRLLTLSGAAPQTN